MTAWIGRYGGRVHPIKTVKDVGQVLRLDAGARIANFKTHAARLGAAPQSNLHTAAGGRAFNGIINQVIEQPPQPAR